MGLAEFPGRFLMYRMRTCYEATVTSITLFFQDRVLGILSRTSCSLQTSMCVLLWVHVRSKSASYCEFWFKNNARKSWSWKVDRVEVVCASDIDLKLYTSFPKSPCFVSLTDVFGLGFLSINAEEEGKACPLQHPPLLLKVDPPSEEGLTCGAWGSCHWRALTHHTQE